MALLLGLLGLRANAQPTIFNWSESANPGDVISLQGDSFGNTPQVWMERVTGTESSLAPAIPLAVLSASGSLNTTGSNSYVSALIPATEPLGLYAVWVSSDGGNTFSPGVYINQTAPWNANDLCGTQVDPNRQFHIYGRNLQFSGTGTPTVNFVSTSSTLVATVTSGTDPYVLGVTAPSALRGGTTYTLMVNNGLGGNYGTVTGPVLTGTITGGSDPFGLGVPWGADFASYSSHVYTVPFVSSTTNMTPAIQAAINAVSGSGGGIVALQSGTYSLSPGSGAFLYMATKVVLEGAGMNNTVLVMTGTSTSSIFNYYGLADGALTLTDCGVANLTLYNTTTGAGSNLSFVHAGHTKFFMVNSEFKSDIENDVIVTGTQLVMNNCVVVGGTGAWVLSGTTMIQDFGAPLTFYSPSYTVLRNNRFEYYNGRISPGANGGSNILFQNNTLNRIAFPVRLGETGGAGVQQCTDMIVLDNVFQRDPVLSGTYNLVQNNDGETILNQTGVCKYPCWGNVSGATSNTLTDTSQDWTNNYGAPNDYQMYYVTIVSGPGAGQMREVIGNTTTTLTVDSPWQVIPGNGSVYSVHHLESLRQLVKDNTLNGEPQGIDYYSISMKDTVIVNNTLTNNGGIYLRSDFKAAPTNLLSVQMNPLVTGNSVTVTSTDPYNETNSFAYVLDWLVMTGTQDIPGTQAFCPEFRGNTVTAPVPNQMAYQYGGLRGEGFVLTPITNGGEPIPDSTTPVSVGGMFQGNTAVSCTNAFHLCTGDYFTTLWGNTLNNCGAPVLDATASGISHASILTISGPVTPAITTQPQSANFIEGQTATFTVIASGITAPGYQWQRLPIGSGTWAAMADVSGTYAGSATGTLSVSNATLAMSGDQLRCVASNGYPPYATSSAATLTVQTGYSAWASGLFGSQFSNSSTSGPAATPQNDGIPNAVKYLCDVNPALPMTKASYAALPVAGTATVSGTSYLTLTYRQNPNIPGLTLSVQTCTDLKSWTAVTPSSIQPIGTDPATGDPIIEIKVQNGGGELFGRLQVTVS